MKSVVFQNDKIEGAVYVYYLRNNHRLTKYLMSVKQRRLLH